MSTASLSRHQPDLMTRRISATRFSFKLPEPTNWQSECKRCSPYGFESGARAQWKGDVHLLKVKLMRVLLLNLSSSSAQEELRALQGEGYVLFTARNLGVDEIISFQAQVLIAEATPSNLSFCHLINQIKSVCDRPIPKIVLIVYGGAVERSRALELGADVVVSAPIEPIELSALIKIQIQAKQSRYTQIARAHERSKESEVSKAIWKHQPAATPKRCPWEFLRRVLAAIAVLIAICERELTQLRFPEL